MMKTILLKGKREPENGNRKVKKIMKMISISITVFAATAILAGCGKSTKSSGASGDSTAAAANKGERKVLYWYDPMNPTIHFDHPGKSPTMDMDLVPKYADEVESNPNIVRIDPAMIQDIGVVIDTVSRRKLTRTINTYGVVVPDEKSIADINTRVSGWVETLYFNYTGMNVGKDQPMAVIYSPDLIAAEQEFLQSVSFAKVSSSTISSSEAGSQLIKSSRERLRFFGMSDKEIDKLESTGNVIDKVVIHSPADGVILEKDVFEGQRISAGQTLFRVADLHHVWVLADVFKIDMPFLKMGAPTTVSYSNSETFNGAVDFIYPEVDATARSVKARIALYNPGMVMKVGQYVNVAIHSPISYDALAVPSQAVINTGLRQIVAVALGGGRFEIRDVKLGTYADGYYEVLDGLQDGEAIVKSGQFLIDSDANLNGAGAAMAGMPEKGERKKEKGERKTEHGKRNTENSMNGMDMPGMKMKSAKPETGKRTPASGLRSPNKMEN
ncbi:MAG: efflux RND transporter periplasmic adaptor subunit [Bacteroidetes bacterium]|nr:efflux RND transporter periplasmic adaptor subunit [Bacteroidota bacterium]